MIETPTLSAMLADAVGDDPGLLAELRRAFLEAATAQRRRLAALDAASWPDAALRLASLAASFGAVGLLNCATEAGAGRPTESMLRRIDLELALLHV
ncbi:hypothetical protein [Sphingomonas jatrophae]|uniref:Hpt domain-containing protein n=1 Tax=Sphingomonas jatrophae TaxID=1166337 RepID=A0A1I6JV51_9SPHN|nr:hypothetical protein [Sphingomonas jatrophae]SFR82833.1 hypothetical protein SAMN05192580_0926 [Sphingomonas jatrophae]